jgi:hypothetical protein
VADELEAYLAKKRGGGTAVPVAQARQTNDSDPLEQYLTKRRPPPAPSVATSDAGPGARRAAAGMSPGPREHTDEELGIANQPVTGTALPVGEARNPTTGQTMPVSMFPGPKDPGGAPEVWTNNPEESGDTMVQSALLGAGAGRVVGPVASKLLPARAVPVATAATEGAVASKASGGDALTGAALGGAIPALGAAGGGVKAAIAKGAPARVQERMHRNLTEPVGQRVADKVTRVLGPEGERMAPVLDRNPQLRKALALDASDNPATALRAVKETKDAANINRHADFERMQEHFADKPPSSQATISGMLDDYQALRKTNLGDRERQAILAKAEAELRAFGDDLRAAQGLPPAVNGDYSGTVITPKDLRAFEQTIGGRAYDVTTPASVKARVNSELYAPLAKQVNQLAENTPGVNAKRFAETGQDIHVLIPVEESLAANVKAQQQGRPTWRETAKAAVSKVANIGSTGGIVTGIALQSPAVIAASAAGLAASAAHKIAGRVGRRIDFRLAEGQRTGAPAIAAPASRGQLSPIGAGIAAGAATDRGKPGLSDLY